MFGELAEVGDRIAADNSVRAVVLSGAGDNFCAGIDTSIMGSDIDFTAALQPCEPSPANVFQRAAYVWREVPVPVICSIHGAAFGAGLQLALGGGSMLKGLDGLIRGRVDLPVYVAEDPLTKARETAAAIAGRSPDAIRAMKRLFNEAWEMSAVDALRLEAVLQTGVMGGENQREAVAANVKKRAPTFRDPGPSQ